MATSLAPCPILVPQKDGTVKERPFAECTVEKLKLAVKHKRTPPKPLPEEATARVDSYRGALDRHYPKDSHIRVSARVERGKVLISLRDIPDEQLSTLIKALRSRFVGSGLPSTEALLTAQGGAPRACRQGARRHAVRGQRP
jgi:hypothetical protein